MGAAPAPEVFTLVPPDQGPRPPLRSLEEWQRQGRPLWPEAWGGRAEAPPPGPAPAGRLVLRRWPDGRMTAEGFPDQADVCAALVARLDPAVARLERGRLYLEAANGAAVYVPVGPSQRPGCTRYGRLYRRLADR